MWLKGTKEEFGIRAFRYGTAEKEDSRERNASPMMRDSLFVTIP
jgi:hypothetical protein